MMLRIDPTSAVAPDQQLCEQIIALTRDGGLRPGDRLPTVRRLAGDLSTAVGRSGPEHRRRAATKARPPLTEVPGPCRAGVS